MTTILTIAVIIIVFIVLFKVFKLLLRLLLVGVFLLIAYFTNPTAEQHQQAVIKKAQSKNLSLKNKTVVVDDYKVFSLPKVSDNEGTHVVGAGAFTQIIIFGKF